MVQDCVQRQALVKMLENLEVLYKAETFLFMSVTISPSGQTAVLSYLVFEKTKLVYMYSAFRKLLCT
jgi:hypothetical protein